MSTMLSHAWALWLILALPLVACGNPCLDLSETVCKCEQTELEQRACLQRVDREASRVASPTPAQEEQCEELLDTCNCDELAEGNLAACGLALETSE